MILLDKYYALEKADNQYQLGIIDEQTKISIIKFLNSLPPAQSDNGYSDGFTDGYRRGLTDAQPDNQINLCDSCNYSYPDCPSKSDDVIFGNGIGNDNICACNKYKPSVTSKQRTGKWIRNDNGTWSCDQCNSWIPDEQHYYARFCLYCGATMEKGEQK